MASTASVVLVRTHQKRRRRRSADEMRHQAHVWWGRLRRVPPRMGRDRVQGFVRLFSQRLAQHRLKVFRLVAASLVKLCRLIVQVRHV